MSKRMRRGVRLGELLLDLEAAESQLVVVNVDDLERDRSDNLHEIRRRSRVPNRSASIRWISASGCNSCSCHGCMKYSTPDCPCPTNVRSPRWRRSILRP